MKRTALLMTALASLVSACGSDPPAPASGRPPAVRLFGAHLTALPGDDGAVRMGLTAFEDDAHVIVRFTPQEAEIDVCPMLDFDDPIPARDACETDSRSGVRETVGLAGMRALAIVVRSDHVVSFELVAEWTEGERVLSFGLPALRAPMGGADCSDNACNPFFEIEPTRNGPFEASVRWDGPPAELVLLQGRVKARAQTATGARYGEPARAAGPSPLSIQTRLSAPGEYALAFRHGSVGTTSDPLSGIVIDASWP